MDKVLETAVNLRELGIAVHWLRPRTKIPILNGWNSAPIMSDVELKRTYKLGYNVGIRPGLPSRLSNGDHLLVLDVDVRGGQQFAMQAYEAARRLTNQQNFTVISGSLIGRHVYLSCPSHQLPQKAAQTLIRSETIVNGKYDWQIELLGTGKNVVAPPSIHPDSGQSYVWDQE